MGEGGGGGCIITKNKIYENNILFPEIMNFILLYELQRPSKR